MCLCVRTVSSLLSFVAKSLEHLGLFRLDRLIEAVDVALTRNGRRARPLAVAAPSTRRGGVSLRG
jgi:hypothetical protein